MRAPERRTTGATALLVTMVLASVGCAKREPPSGGPPDVESPRVIASSPDSGAARVALDAPLAITFSEGMEPRSTEESVDLAPRIPVRKRHWSGRTLTLTLSDSLRRHHTYTLFVAATARDRHGNDLGAGRTVVFSTDDSFPPGRMSGEVDARGMAAEAITMWCYDEAQGHRPDSTARDFDALALVDHDSRFSVDGLRVPGRFRLWAFADLNHNHSYEPDVDVLVPVDTTFTLTPERPIASDLKVPVVNPRAPGHVRGTVRDTLADSLGVLRVLAVSAKDSSLRVVESVDADGSYEIELTAGRWTVRAFRDLNGDQRWQPESERAGDPIEVVVEPAADVLEIHLRLRPHAGGP